MIKEYMKELKRSACIACSVPGISDIHHIKSRGSGGKNDVWNMIPLCRFCHSFWHQAGYGRFFKKFPHVLGFLLDLGWELNGSKLRYYAARETSSKPDTEIS